MALSRALVLESAVAYSVTSCPRATSPSVRSDVIVSTDPDLGGGIVVATGAMWAIRNISAAPEDGVSPGHTGADATRVRDRGSRAGDLEQARQDDVRVEMLARDFGGAARVPIVARVDCVDARERFLGRREGEQADPRRQVRGPAGILHERGTTRGQVALRPIAEPAGSVDDVRVFGDAELG